MNRCANVNRAALIAFCSLSATTPVRAGPPQDDQFHTGQLQDDQLQPKHKKLVVHRVEPAVQLRHTMRDEINHGLLGIVAEGTDYTVDLALTLTSEQTHLRPLPIAGAGALQNAKDVMFARGIDFAIVQTDVLDEIKREPPFPGVEKYLRYVTKLYDQELQVLAGPDIQSIDDLRGKKINFGLRDSGTYTTATAVFKALGVEPDVTNIPQAIALDKLRRGEISGLVYVATKPSRLFQDIRPDENLHFLPITGNLPPNYTAVTITSDDYPELVSKDAPVKTVAVGTVLVAYNWPTKSERYQRVNGFVQAFFANLKEIKARRPKWKDFDVTASVSGWTRFPVAEEWLKRSELTPGTATARGAESGGDSRQASSQAQISFDPEQRDALFREFAAYQRNPVHPKQREALFRDFAEYQKRQHQIIIAFRGTASDH